MLCRLFELLFENLSSLSAEGAVLNVLVREDSQSGDVKLEFWADGLRLPKEVLRYVFDPFYAQDTTPSDAGINLLFCYFIVHHHGGELIATADESDITRYMISLPREQGAATSIKDDEEFLHKVFAAEEAWEHLLTS
jgi:K+-sensing histidine kinase KdpD